MQNQKNINNMGVDTMKSRKITAIILSVLVASGATVSVFTGKNVVQAKEVGINRVQSKIATNIGVGQEYWDLLFSLLM